GEDAKIGVRNDRKTAMNDLKKLGLSEDLLKTSEEEVQELTNAYIAKIDKIVTVKEAEIMKV
ncbi:MAG: ribosome recycling factor, partial [Nonlabens ulvanivorans]